MFLSLPHEWSSLSLDTPRPGQRCVSHNPPCQKHQIEKHRANRRRLEPSSGRRCDSTPHSPASPARDWKQDSARYRHSWPHSRPGKQNRWNFFTFSNFDFHGLRRQCGIRIVSFRVRLHWLMLVTKFNADAIASSRQFLALERAILFGHHDDCPTTMRVHGFNLHDAERRPIRMHRPATNSHGMVRWIVKPWFAPASRSGHSEDQQGCCDSGQGLHTVHRAIDTSMFFQVPAFPVVAPERVAPERGRASDFLLFSEIMTRIAGLLLLLAAGLSAAPPARAPETDSRLRKSFRRPDNNGWTFVRLEGSPSEIGYQHGYLLASEIADTHKTIVLSLTHDSSKDYAFFRNAAEKVLWPHIEGQYREELKGIVEGLHAKNVPLDIWDVVTLNAFLELTPYYTGWYDKQHKLTSSKKPVPEHCSAFVATGSYTTDGGRHRAQMDGLHGGRAGQSCSTSSRKRPSLLMDGFPGRSTAATISASIPRESSSRKPLFEFSGYDPKGIPEFVRARKAMQYSSSIDDFARIMKEATTAATPTTGWWRKQEQRNRQPRTRPEERHAVTKDGRIFRWLQLSHEQEADAGGDRISAR